MEPRIVEHQVPLPLAIRLAILATLYSLGLLGLFAALNNLIHY